MFSFPAAKIVNRKSLRSNLFQKEKEQVAKRAFTFF